MFPEFGMMVRPPCTADALTFDSLGELLDSGIREFSSNESARYFFRGECGFFPDSLPNIFRSENLFKQEKQIFQDALNRVPALFENCPTTFDKLCQMQHYEFPTRILDVTTDLATAWFMAVDGWVSNEVVKNACNPQNSVFFCPNIVVFRIPDSRKKFADSDLVSALANIVRMNENFDIWDLRHEVRQERYNFGENVKFMKERILEEWGSNWVVYPRMSNPRVRRQKGAFILCGLTQENCEELACGRKIKKTRKDPRTGLCYPKLQWNPWKQEPDEISICGRFVPSRKLFREVSDAIAAGTTSYHDAERIKKAAEKFREKIFRELEFVGCGRSEMYPDNYKIQAEGCRRHFESI